MFTKANIRNGSTYFTAHLSASYYYSQGERDQRQPLGALAERFGITSRLVRRAENCRQKLGLPNFSQEEETRRR